MSSSKRLCQYDVSGTGTGIYMNLDLMLQVLVRLPIKSLIKFKSVCKNWNSLISSREFANLHQQHAINNPKDDPSLQVIISCGSYRGNQHLYNFKIEPNEVDEVFKSHKWYYTLSKPAQKLNHKFEVESYPIGSCNGLICFVVGLEYNTLCLWNPATQDSYSIKGPRLPEGSVPLSWGFGYDPLSDDYKILVLVKLDDLNTKPFAKIYTLRTDEWNRVECPSDHELSEFVAWESSMDIREKHNSLPVLVGESLYWRKNGVFYPKNILAFDLRRDLFEIVPLPRPDPSTIGHTCRDFFICQLSQSLYACWLWNECDRDLDDSIRKPLYMTVWRMDGCHGTEKVWKCVLKCKGLERCYDRIINLLPKLFELKEHGRYLISSPNFQLYLLIDPKGERHNPSVSVNITSNFDFVSYVFDYTPSLASPTHHLATKMDSNKERGVLGRHQVLLSFGNTLIK